MILTSPLDLSFIIDDGRFELFKFGKSNLENCEMLEQLRLIDSGYNYETFLAKGQHLSIDTEKQYSEAKKIMEN